MSCGPQFGRWMAEDCGWRIGKQAEGSSGVPVERRGSGVAAVRSEVGL